MISTTYLLEAVILFIALQAAILLRLTLPIGSAIYTAPIITPPTYLFLLCTWGISIGFRHLITKKYPTQIAWLRIIPTGLFLSLAEYLVISNENASFSRLFVLFFLLANLLGVFASSHVTRLLYKHENRISEWINELREIFTSINSWLYRSHAEVIASLFISLVWANYIIKMGLTLAGDALGYLGIAINVFAGKPFVAEDLWPPVYPFALALTRYFTQFPADGAAIISAVTLVIFFVVFALLLREFCCSSFFNIIFILLLATLFDFIDNFLNVRSEQLFSLFLISAFYMLVKHRTKLKWIYFGGAILFTSLAIITRYIGIGMGIMLVIYAVFFSEAGTSIVTRTRKYVLPSLAAFIPFAYLLWLDTTSHSADITLPGIAQIEQGKIFVYSLGLFSISNTVLAFIKEFWQSTGHLYIVLISGLFLYILVFNTKSLGKSIRELLKFNTIFFFGSWILTISAITFSGSYPVPRYWIPSIFFLFLVMAQTMDITFRSHPQFALKSETLRSTLLVIIVAALLYSLTLQSTGALNILVDRVRDSYQDPKRQIVQGFNLSPTSKNFRDFFDLISRRYSSYTIVLIDGDLTYNPVSWETLDDSYYETTKFELDDGPGRLFLLKSSLFSSPTFSDFRFHDIQAQEQYLTYSYNNELKHLHLIIPDTSDILNVINQFDQSARSYSDQGVFIIVNEQLFKETAYETLASELGKLRQVARIEPYLVLELWKN